MRTPLAAVGLAALLLTPAAAQTPAAPAAAPAAPSARPDPAVAVATALKVCLGAATSAEALTAEGEKAGFGPFMPRQMQDPTGAPLSFHKIGPGEFGGGPILAVIRRRTLSEPGQQPVEWTECGLAFEPGGQNVRIATELARTLGPGRPKGGAIGWAWRLSGDRRQAILLPTATGWSPEVEVAQTLDPSERIATLTVTSAGRVTWIQVGYFRLKQRGER